MNYVGIDLHSNNNYMVITNQQGRRLLEKRLPNDVGVILEWLRRYDPIESVALESTYNYYWLADGLLDGGHRVKLANPLAMKPYAGLKHQDDRSEAGFIAELLRLGSCPQGTCTQESSAGSEIYSGREVGGCDKRGRLSSLCRAGLRAVWG